MCIRDSEELGLDQEQVQEQEQEQEQEEEQQKEQQVEQEQDNMPEAPEEAARQKYARDNEAPNPWPTAVLEQPPNNEASPFYGWSHFRIFNPGGGGDNGAPPTLGLRFPETVCLSTNFYNSGLHASKPRRMKNLVMALEWCPYGPAYGDDQNRMTPPALNPVALEQLQAVYSLSLIHI